MSGTSCSQRNPSQWKNVTPHTNKKALNTARDKRISADSLIKLAEFVLKNNIFEHNKSVFKELRGTAIGTKMAPPYAIIFMGSLEENIPSNSLLKLLVWLLYIDDIAMVWENGENELKKVFRVFILPSSYYKVYSRILWGNNKLSRCDCFEKK